MTHTIIPYVVDYPEAQETYKFLQGELNLPPAQTLKGIGVRPDAKSVKAHNIDAQPFLFLNGSGKFHHDTAPVVEGFVANRPDDIIYYVQIDAHPDKEEIFRWKLDCANFVGRLMQQNSIRRFFLLGTWPPCLDVEDIKTNVTKHIRYYRRRFFKVFRQYVIAPSDVSETFFGIDDDDLSEAQTNPSVATAEMKRVTLEGPGIDDDGLVVTWKTLDDFNFKELKRPVYLSIDLDVLQTDLITDWRVRHGEGDLMGEGYGDNHGRMPLKQLLHLIRSIGETTPVLAGDICGITADLDHLTPKAKQQSLNTVKEVYAAMLDVIQTSQNL